MPPGAGAARSPLPPAGLGAPSARTAVRPGSGLGQMSSASFDLLPCEVTALPQVSGQLHIRQDLGGRGGRPAGWGAGRGWLAACPPRHSQQTLFPSRHRETQGGTGCWTAGRDGDATAPGCSPATPAEARGGGTGVGEPPHCRDPERLSSPLHPGPVLNPHPLHLCSL